MGAISGISSAAATAATLTAQTTPNLNKGQKAAREFEAQLIGSLLESLEKTFATVPGEPDVAGEDDYNYLGTQALASVLAAGGGFGIARLISAHLGGTKGVAAPAEGSVKGAGTSP
jgi:Rod binding domain-containing protein